MAELFHAERQLQATVITTWMEDGVMAWDGEIFDGISGASAVGTAIREALEGYSCYLCLFPLTEWTFPHESPLKINLGNEDGTLFLDSGSRAFRWDGQCYRMDYWRHGQSARLCGKLEAALRSK